MKEPALAMGPVEQGLLLSTGSDSVQELWAGFS